MKIYPYVKTMADILLAGLLIIALLPMLVVLSLCLSLSLKGNPFFTQQRPGYLGKPFYLLKFKTMLDTCDEHGELLPDMIRVTKLGKFIRKLSIDELPQLFNVLMGQMSFVGPRPLLMEYLPLYTQEEAKRHLVKPGITGLAQVNGRNAISWKEKFKHDVYYAEHYTFTMDVKIVLWTLKKVLAAEGVNASAQNTMIKYNGRN